MKRALKYFVTLVLFTLYITMPHPLRAEVESETLQLKSWTADLSSKDLDDAVPHREIWFVPQSSIAPSPLSRAADLLDMFKPEAPWQEAASHTKVFAIYHAFWGPASQDQVNTIVQDLKRRHIALAVEGGMMNINFKPTPPCGGLGFVEGYGTAAGAHMISQKIKKAGGEIRYIAMDEPFYYGHYFNGPHACHHSIDEVVRLVSETLNAYLEEFPNAVIGDIEPTSMNQPTWKEDLIAFTTRYRQVMKRPLAFLQLDVEWFLPHGAEEGYNVFKLTEDLKKQNLIEKTAIIYNGNPVSKTDAEWTASARNQFLHYEDDLKIHPDQIIVQSWRPHPVYTLPESSNTTLTSLVNFYHQHMSDIQ